MYPKSKLIFITYKVLKILFNVLKHETNTYIYVRVFRSTRIWGQNGARIIVTLVTNQIFVSTNQRSGIRVGFSFGSSANNFTLMVIVGPHTHIYIYIYILHPAQGHKTARKSEKFARHSVKF